MINIAIDGPAGAGTRGARGRQEADVRVAPGARRRREPRRLGQDGRARRRNGVGRALHERRALWQKRTLYLHNIRQAAA